MRAVVKMPVIRALNLLPVAFCKIMRSFWLLIFINESRIRFSPKRNNAKPPIIKNIFLILSTPINNYDIGNRNIKKTHLRKTGLNVLCLNNVDRLHFQQYYYNGH